VKGEDEKMQKLRFAIIGAGRPNQNFGSQEVYHGVGEYHARAISEYAELAAIASKSERSAAFLATKFGVKDIYTDYRKILDRKDIDAVTIATPSGMHGEIAQAAAQAGKHILIEKPIEVTLEKAEAVVEECERNKVKLAVAFHHRFGILGEIKAAVDNGEIGKLLICNAFCKRYRNRQYFQSSNWRGTWALDGGGALMNQGIHIIDSFQWIAGDVASIFGYVANLVHPYVETEDVAVASIRFKKGCMGIIESTICSYPDLADRIELHGEKGSIIADGYPMQIRLKESIGQNRFEGEVTKKEQPVMYIGMHHGLIQDLIQSIEEDREPRVNGREGLKSLRIITAIYESAKKSEEIIFE
jgi:UDP-N-acetyl-2-amino-2-deoxyglucuronate dehydrogenase